MISEPMTMATDYLLAAVAGGLGARLLRLGAGPGRRSVRLWGAAFLAAALAAVAGGTRHGFARVLPPGGILVLWKTTLLTVGVGSFLMLSGTLLAACRGRLRTALLAASAGKLAVYAWWMLREDDFGYAVLDYVVAMAAVLLLQGIDPARGRTAARWTAAGVLLGFVAAALQRWGVGFHTHFNHNDLYHVLQCGALALLYRGARELRDA